MRTLLLTGAILLLFPAPPLQAQSVSAGVKLGLSTSHQILEYGSQGPRSTDASMGPVAGATVAIELLRHLDLQIEGLYVERGMSEGDGSWVRLAYLEMPILTRLRTALPRLPFHGFAVAGLAPAKEVSCSGELRRYPPTGGCLFTCPPPPPPPPLEPVDCIDVRSYTGDVGAILGGGLSFSVRGRRAEIEMRYTRGITDLARGYDRWTRHSRALGVTFAVTGMPIRTGGG
jgi:hypothetical protein